jgi:hypothetical protein
MQFINFGNGLDGIWTPGATTYTPIAASCAGTVGATSLSATNASFVAGQMIYIWQARGGANVSKWEVNRIASYTAGTITLSYPLDYTYTDSGSSQAQVIVMPQYSGITLDGLITTTAWDQDRYGVIPLLCTGKTLITSTVSLKGKGYAGGIGSGNVNINGGSAEGSAGDGIANSTAANGNGAGGASGDGGNGTPGSGGSYATAGGDAHPGNIVGAADLNSGIYFGGGGGGDATDSSTPQGGSGGGVFLLFSRQIVISGAGLIDASGGNGVTSRDTGTGGGAGGSIFLKGEEINYGINALNVDGGVGGVGTFSTGATGGKGRIRVEGCRVSGGAIPAASEVKGGFGFCSSGIISML